MTDTLPAGRELDALVAERVMGFTWKRWPVRYAALKGLAAPNELEYWTELQGDEVAATDYLADVPRYSTSWDAMRLVVERLVALSCSVATEVGPRGVSCSVFRDRPRIWAVEDSDTLPHAVCLAALAALKATEAQHA